MLEIEEKDTVTLAFIGKLDNGHIFKEVTSESPIKVTIGNSELPPSVETAITGLKKGEKKTIRISPEEGYGPRLKDLIHTIPASSFGDRITPVPGMVLSQKIEKDGKLHEIPVTVVETNKDQVTIDYNHPAAGHHLTYEIVILEITKH